MCENEEIKTFKYYCEFCDHYSNSKFNFERHNLTNRHNKLKNDYKIIINEEGKKVFIKNNNTFECKCGKRYNHQTNLIRHKKTNCKINDIVDDNKIDYNLIITKLLNENKEMRKTISELVEKIK